MYQDEQIIAQLNIEALPDDEKTEVIREAQVRIGETISEELTEEQLVEYQAIIDGNEQVIATWLEKNVPHYKDEAIYQSFEEGYESDPEHNSPAKLFASIAWIQLTVPHIQDLVAKVIESFKQERSVR
jgi:SNF2 family DNA or RNA helicase